MKILIVLVLVVALAAPMCLAQEAQQETKAKDPITATAEVAGKVIAAPVEAVCHACGAKKADKPE